MVELEKGNWPVDAEVSLFHAMRGHKPVGVNKHFQMLFIHEKLNSSSSRKISSKDIWDHLSSMYDLQALNESEIIPFPNKESDFDLPGEDFKVKDTSRNATDFSQEDKSESKSDSGTKHGKSEKNESKQIENKHTSNVLHANTPENSPKRKRTRNTPSANASPATPDVPPPKRRR
ncbi:MRG/MORF4L-binding protein-like isoform X2 [Saccostrea echinata]|uniref:MRG/MORF4L-binding protein-like isoform X2 n=1 Tax=Saccostrea echinata TaxID=191078 RepID=UPI002A815B50|nr:MRG/MORF4L-binding protein-like isoform X2 [Saccostrea echinata]